MRLEERQPVLLRRTVRADQQQQRTMLGEAVAERLAALQEVIITGEGRLPDKRLDPARELHRRAGERLRVAGSHTVVALAGSTGSGKSSLFNALAEVELSAAGVRRPTTGAPHAVIWGAAGAGALLDWLQVSRRHYLDFLTRPDEGDHRLDGLVLLDLPDHDSTTVAHRVEVDRLVELVDVLVWVLDPQKYADAVVHERYLRPLAEHAGVTVVVLNQADRLPAYQVDLALNDLRRLLAADGLGSVPVLATSAVTAGGLDGLRAVLIDAVAAHVAALRRLTADLDGVAAGLRGVVAGPAPQAPDPAAVSELNAALCATAGVSAVGAAVRRAYLSRAAAAMGSPLLRWLRRPDPDRTGDPAAEPARPAVPEPGPVPRPRADAAQRALADQASAGLPDPWPAAVRAAARSRSAELSERLDRAVADLDIEPTGQPAWWRAIGAVQVLLAAVAVAGGLWLAGRYALPLLGLPDPGAPVLGPAVVGPVVVDPVVVDPVPLPTLLLVGGLLLGLALAVPARLVARLLAGREATRAEARLREVVADAAGELVVGPVRAELAAHNTVRAALTRLQRR